MSDTIRWGILGTGKIARALAAALRDTPGAHLAAVASRSLSSAERFAADFNHPLAFGSYQELADADGIDIVYIATPAPDARGERDDGPQRRQGGPVRKAVHHEPARGRTSRRPRTRKKAVPDGGHVDPLHAGIGGRPGHHRVRRDRSRAPGHGRFRFPRTCCRAGSSMRPKTQAFAAAASASPRAAPNSTTCWAAASRLASRP